MCTQFRCAPLRIKKALGIFRALITRLNNYSGFLGPAFRVQKSVYAAVVWLSGNCALSQVSTKSGKTSASEQPFVWSYLPVLTISKSSEGIELELSSCQTNALLTKLHSILMLVLLEDVSYTYTRTIMQWEWNTNIICQSLQSLHNWIFSQQ